jgi:hypothetical protein
MQQKGVCGVEVNMLIIVHELLQRLLPDPDVIGQWCVIHYDKSVYPGIIQDIDNESAEVNCMCSIGNNRFFWGLVEDCLGATRFCY